MACRQASNTVQHEVIDSLRYINVSLWWAGEEMGVTKGKIWGKRNERKREKFYTCGNSECGSVGRGRCRDCIRKVNIYFSFYITFHLMNAHKHNSVKYSLLFLWQIYAI